jgi:dihydrofolate reductase
MKECEEIFLTKVFKEYECDTFFPIIDENFFFQDLDYLKNDSFQKENDVEYQFCLFKRKILN